MCNGAAKQVSAGVAQFSIIGNVKRFKTSVERQVSRKIEPLSISASVEAIALVIKTVILVLLFYTA